MTPETEKSILVLGLGNLLLGDEGVGVHVVKKIAQMELPSNVEVVDGGTGGFELIEHVHGKSKVVIVDCLRVDATPGSIMRLLLDDVSTFSHAPLSSHEGGVQELLTFMKTLTPLPEVVVYGIVPERIDHIEMQLSPAVELQLDKIISLVMNEVRSTFPITA